jgi:hypothetical protein
MEMTLFGVIETKTEMRNRAKQIFALLASLRDAPGAVEARTGQIMDLRYFIDRSQKRKMGPNDWDGLHRLIGDPEELLTDAEKRAHVKNPKNLKPYKYGWMNRPPGELWVCCLHRKEIAYLVSQIDFLKGEIETIKGNVVTIREELKHLREIGPLAKDVADRYGLTEAGDWKPKPVPPAK